MNMKYVDEMMLRYAWDCIMNMKWVDEMMLGYAWECIVNIKYVDEMMLRNVWNLLVCNWTHSVWTKSLVCKDAVLQGISLFRSVSEDSGIRKVGSLPAVWMIVLSRSDDDLSTIPSLWTMCHTVRTTWILVRKRFSLRQESQFKFNCLYASLPLSGRACIWYGNCGFNFNHPDACLSWSGRLHHKYGNCVLKINRPDGHPLWSGRVKALYGNYLRQTCNHLDDSASLSGHGSQTGKIFSENLRNSIAQLSVQTAHVHHPDSVRTYYSSRPFEPSAYK